MKERWQKILTSQVYIDLQSTIDKHEITRKFCHHDLAHLLDVCRIMYIIANEMSLSVSKDEIYAAGLLHDIGRAREYEEGIKHSCVDFNFINNLLNDCDYTSEEIHNIYEAIVQHSNRDNLNTIENISGLLKYADKKSRLCFCCLARGECKWKEEEKNKVPRT